MECVNELGCSLLKRNKKKYHYHTITNYDLLNSALANVYLNCVVLGITGFKLSFKLHCSFSTVLHKRYQLIVLLGIYLRHHVTNCMTILQMITL